MVKIPFSDLRVMSMLPGVLSRHIDPNALEDILSTVRDGLLQDYQKPSPEALWGTVSKCRRCPNRAGNPELPMWNIKDPKVLFLTERKLSRPEAIKIFMSAAKACDFSSEDVCLSWAVRCPFKDKHTDDDFDRCSEYLWTEITALQPSVVVPMGSKVASYFIPIEKLGENRGEEFWIGPWRIVPTFSPDYVAMSNSGKIEQEFIADMRKIRSFVK
jgi:hypothetical protein